MSRTTARPSEPHDEVARAARAFEHLRVRLLRRLLPMKPLRCSSFEAHLARHVKYCILVRAELKIPSDVLDDVGGCPGQIGDYAVTAVGVQSTRVYAGGTLPL